MAALAYSAQKGNDNKKAYTTPVVQPASGGGSIIGSNIIIKPVKKPA